MSRYVTARKEHQCTFCKELITEGSECVQSLANWGLFYHPDCYNERYEGHGEQFIQP